MTEAHSRPSSGSLPLLCALGRHKTDLLVRWNDGYYFTRCRRCGLDLVRTAFSGWVVPKRYRVVWQAEPPAASEEVQLAPRAAENPMAAGATAPESASGASEPQPLKEQVEFPIREAALASSATLSMTEEAFAARPAEDDVRDERSARSVGLTPQGRKEDLGTLPIEDVLQSLRAETAAPTQTSGKTQDLGEPAVAERDPEPVSVAAPTAPPPRPRTKYPVIPDFMDEEFPGITWDPATGRMISDENDVPEPASREVKPGWREAIREKAQAATASGLELLRTRTPAEQAPREEVAEPTPQRTAPSRSFLERHGGLVAATVFGGFVLAAAVVDGRRDGVERIAYRPELRVQEARPASDARPAGPRTASAAARPSGGGDEAFVTASLLNCRAVPTNDGETVRRLSRGDAVKVLGADPGWVSVSHQGRQCWASSQWISTVKPL